MMLSFTINSPKPQFFFCQQTLPMSHYDRGMVFTINLGQSIDLFLDNIKNIWPLKEDLTSINALFLTLMVSKDLVGSGISFIKLGTATGTTVTKI